MRQVVASNLRRIRGERSLTLDELSFRAEVDRSYISQLEQGKHNPSAVILGKLAKALNVKASALLEVPSKPARRQSKPKSEN